MISCNHVNKSTEYTDNFVSPLQLQNFIYITVGGCFLNIVIIIIAVVVIVVVVVVVVVVAAAATAAAVIYC